MENAACLEPLRGSSDSRSFGLWQASLLPEVKVTPLGSFSLSNPPPPPKAALLESQQELRNITNSLHLPYIPPATDMWGLNTHKPFSLSESLLIPALPHFLIRGLRNASQ